MPTLSFEPIAHTYELDGQRVPSVTGVLKDSGLIDLSKIPSFILEAARRRGSDVHALVHFANEGDLDWASVDPQYAGYLDAWMAYCRERQLQVTLCEYRIASVVRRVAGTFDVLATITEPGLHAGDGALIDVKTGNPDDAAADLQTGAYLGMAYEWAAFDPVLAAALGRYQRIHRFAVRLRKHGAFSVEPYSDPRDTSRFHTLAEAWHIRRERGAIVALDDLAA